MAVENYIVPAPKPTLIRTSVSTVRRRYERRQDSTSTQSIYVPSRYYLGPLTTKYSPPAPCATGLILGGESEGVGSSPSFYGPALACSNTVGTGSNSLPYVTVLSQCFPPSFNYFPTSTTGADNYITQPVAYYSPASECPYGWSSACGATSASVFEGDAFLATLISPGEAIQVCCPEDWACPLDIDWKTQPLLLCRYSWTSPTITLTGSSCASDNITPLATVTYTGLSVGDFVADVSGIVLVQQAPATPSIATSTSPGSQSTQSSPASTATQNSDSSSGGLSSGAQAGIGIGVALAVILAAALGFLLWYRKYRRQPNMAGDNGQNHPYGAMGQKMELTTYPNGAYHNSTPTQFAELPSGYMPEMDGGQRPQEMPHDAPTKSRAGSADATFPLMTAHEKE